jgi:uncharacterized protein (PEP-CTERM system associated)
VAVPLLRQRPVQAGVAAALLLPWLATTGQAQPQPPTAGGFFVDERFQGQRAAPGLGGLDPFAYPFAQGPAAQRLGPERAWSITPALGLQLLGTDNVNNAATNRRSDLITTITPSLDAAASAARITGRLSYLPSAHFYADTPGRNGIDHRFNGQALATLVENSLFLDLRGFGGLQAITGGFSPDGSTVTDRRNQAQTASLSASPYFIQRIGNTATLQAGYSLQYSLVDGRATTLPGSSQPFFTTQETTTHQGYAVLRSGDEFGRAAFELRSTGSVSEGTGVLAGSSRTASSAQLLYAVTREAAVLVEGGYEEQHYRGTNPFDIAGPIWSVGMRLTPTPDSRLIFTYGRRDGFESFRLDANADIGVRTNVFAAYNEGLGAATLQAGNLLNQAGVDQYGNFISPNTGAPINSPFGGSLLATQNALFRQTRGILGARQIWDRDSFNLLFTYTDSTPVTAAAGTQAFAQKGWSIGFNWSRLLTPNLTGTLGAQYGITQTGRTATNPGGDTDVYSFRASLAQELAPGLFGNLQYLFSGRDVQGFSNRVFTNIIILSLRQVF